MSTKGYPSPEQYEFPPIDKLSPDQEFYLGWYVQHIRLWRMLLGVSVLLLASIMLNIVQIVKYTPAVKFVTLQGGLPVVYNEKGQLEVGGEVYEPALMRGFISTFIDSRYAYNWENLQKVNKAFALMTPDAASREKVKLSKIDVIGRIYQRRAKWTIEEDYENWEVIAKEPGVFNVVVPVKVLIQDVENIDSASPMSVDGKVELIVKKDKKTADNPYGYLVTATVVAPDTNL